MAHEGKALDAALDHISCEHARRTLALHQIELELDRAGNPAVGEALERVWDVLNVPCGHPAE